MTVFDLEEMELAYSPQYGSAKDPINMVGFVASGLLRGEHPQVDVEAVMPTGQRPFLVDVRTPLEFAAGHIPDAVNIPVDDLRSRLGELPRDREIAVYCQVGQRGYLATRILRQAGFGAVNVGGGYKTYLLFHPMSSEIGQVLVATQKETTCPRPSTSRSTSPLRKSSGTL
jgi:rhodanese-related sulfurtransferase